MGAHQNRLGIGFYEEISKIIPYHQISNTHVVSSSDVNVNAVECLHGSLRLSSDVLLDTIIMSTSLPPCSSKLTRVCIASSLLCYTKMIINSD